jgi:hypothetical protein
MRDERGPWYLITGLVLGIVLGLFYAWVVSPVEYVDTSPASLRADFKDQYRALIAAAYVADGNLARAQARLNLLADVDEVRTLAEQAQRSLAEGGSRQAAQDLGLLAAAIGQGPTPLTTSSTAGEASPISTSTITSTPMTVSTESSLTPTSTTMPLATEVAPTKPVSTDQNAETTSIPSPSFVPLPTRTPTTTPEAPLVLQDRTFICDQKLNDPLIQVLAEDAAGKPVPSVEVVVNWEGGEDHFFTGLKPELGLGYADFTMTPGVEYTLRLAAGGQVISGLTAAECETQTGGRYWGSWQLVFSQP